MEVSFPSTTITTQRIYRRAAPVRAAGTGRTHRDVGLAYYLVAGTGRTHRDVGLAYYSVDFDVLLSLVPTQPGDVKSIDGVLSILNTAYYSFESTFIHTFWSTIKNKIQKQIQIRDQQSFPGREFVSSCMRTWFYGDLV
jgi:hypothetical protein